MDKKSTKHTGRNIFLVVLATILLLLVAFFVVDYSHYAKDQSPYKTFIIPRLELSVFQITTLSADKADMVGRMLIHNPLPFNLRADSLQYQVYISGVEVIKSTYAKSIDIKRWDSSWVDLPVTAYNDQLVTVLKQAEKEGKDSVVYEVQANFATYLVFHKKFNLDIKKLLPLIYLPEASLDKIEYDSLNTEGVSLFLHATVVNKNKFPFKFKNMAFRFALADNAWVSGTKPGVTDIRDTSVTPLVLPLRISFKEIGKSILPLLKHGKNTPYKFEATLELVSDNNAMRNSKVILKNAGSIKEIVQLAKEEKKEAKEKKKNNPPPAKPKHKIKIEKKKNS